MPQVAGVAAGILSQNYYELDTIWRGRCAAIVVSKLKMWAYIRDPSQPDSVKMLYNGWGNNDIASINRRAEEMGMAPITCALRNITLEDGPARSRRRSTPKQVIITWESDKNRGPEFCSLLHDSLKLEGWYCIRAQRITAGGKIHVPHGFKNRAAVMRFLSDTIERTLGVPVNCLVQVERD